MGEIARERARARARPRARVREREKEKKKERERKKVRAIISKPPGPKLKILEDTVQERVA